VGGLIDAEGSLSPGVLRIAQYADASQRVYRRIARVLRELDVKFSVEAKGLYLHATNGQLHRVMVSARPAKASVVANAVGGHHTSRVIKSVEPTGQLEPVVALTTTVGSFIAGGFVVKNCDTPYTWDWDRYDPAVELSSVSATEVLLQLEGMNVDFVVITGGEPLLQQRRLGALLEGCRERGWRVEVETNGTIPPTVAEGLVGQWNVSPKLANSGIPLDRRYRPDVLRTFEATGRAVFKFVVTDRAELDEIQAMVDRCQLSNVWVMPEGTDADTVTAGLRALAEPVLAKGWHLTPRLHILIWGERRGV
jgi:7-carboxy-7-deazaguanine synthase